MSKDNLVEICIQAVNVFGSLSKESLVAFKGSVGQIGKF